MSLYLSLSQAARDAVISHPQMTSQSVLRAVSWLSGWTYFFCWALASYPQPLVNFRRKSVTGLSVDGFTVTAFGHSCYTLSCWVFLYSGTVREQYRRRGGNMGDPTVRGNDLATAAHALFWSCFTITQFHCWGYTKLPSQKLSRGMSYLILGCLAAIGAVTGLALISPTASTYIGDWEWLDVIYFVGHIKLLISVIKYYPQARLNYINKSTRGWAIHKCVLDFVGSLLSLLQLFIDASLTPGGASSAFRNPVKLWLGCISAGFEVVFMVQHWVLYPQKKSDQYEVESRARGSQDEEAGGLLPDGHDDHDGHI